MAETKQSGKPSDAVDEWPVPWTAVEGSRGGLGAWLEYIAMRSATWSASLLPEFLLRPVISGLARLARAVDKRHTRVAREFVRQALGDSLSEKELDEAALQAYRHLIGMTIRAEGWDRNVASDDWRRHVTLETSPEVEALAGRGAILITPHVGDWEAAAAFLPKIGFNPVYAVARPPKNKPLSQHIQRTRESRGVRVLPRRGAMQHAAKVVEAGGVLCLLIDQRGRDRGAVAPFFGRPALCDRSAGVLLKRLKVPIVMGAVYLTDKPYHFRLHAKTVLNPEAFAGQSVEEIITRINSEIESLILQAPEQYFWLHDRYRGAPEPG